jgi:hypothetical protein
LGSIGASMKENAIVFGRDRSLIGVLTEKGDNAGCNEDGRTGVLLLSSGLDHHVGANRIYVKLARRLSESGSLVFRFGFSGIGDSGPRKDKLPASESVVDETKQAMDYLGHFCGITRFCCIGLCLGANVASEALRVDHRVKEAVLINPQFARSVQGTFEEQRIIYQKHALSNKNSWLRLLTLRSDYQRLWQTLKKGFVEIIKPRIITQRENCDVKYKIGEYFQVIQSKGARILMIFSHTEFGDVYIKKALGKQYRALTESGVVRNERIEDADHSFTPLMCQKELINVISDFLSQTV